MTALYLAACALVFIWSSYCVLSPRVHDGLAGKLLFSTVAIAAAAKLMGASSYADAVLVWALALLGARQFFLKFFLREARDAQDHT